MYTGEASEAATTSFGSYSFGLSAPEESRARRLHSTSTIVDVIWWGPVGYRSFTQDMDSQLHEHFRQHSDIRLLLREAARLPGRMARKGWSEYRRVWDESGVTAGHFDLPVGDRKSMLESSAYLTSLIDDLPWLSKALRAKDFDDAKRAGGHAFYVQCQPMTPISRELGLIDVAYDLGLRVLQLTYNVQDAVGTGCTDRTGGGVTRFGRQLIERLNQLGIIVDGAHCNEQTILNACEFSDQPVIVSHASSAYVYPHDRGISDRVAEAIAASGGVIGVVGHPAFLGTGETRIDTMLDHLDHFVSVVGTDHIAIGTDWPLCAPKWVLERRVDLLASNGFGPEHGIEPTRNLHGFDDYRDFINLTRGLVARGYTDAQIEGILGRNFLRTFGSVCG